MSVAAAVTPPAPSNDGSPNGLQRVTYATTPVLNGRGAGQLRPPQMTGPADTPSQQVPHLLWSISCACALQGSPESLLASVDSSV